MPTSLGLLLFMCLASGGLAATFQRKATAVGSGCSIGLNDDLPKKNEPVLLVRQGDKGLSLVMPQTTAKAGAIVLSEGQELVVACPGNKNSLSLNGKPVSSASCVKESTLMLDNKRVKSEDIECTTRVAASLKNTKNPCADSKGTMVEQGFEVSGWHRLAVTCHNIAESSSYYTVHTVNGASLSGKVNQAYRPGFSRGDKVFFEGFSPDDSYSQKHQLQVFETLLGKKSAVRYLQSGKTFFLARGHLAPDADFIFGSWQLLTYFYINVAPQWQSINAGYWLGVENNVRKLASSLGTDLEVTTGTYGVLKLEGDNGEEKEIYLEDRRRLPVPELYWKLVRDPKTDSCVGLVSTNNPFLSSPPKPLCKDICSQLGWPVLQSELSKGYVYCCSYDQLKKSIKYLPDNKCKSELRFK